MSLTRYQGFDPFQEMEQMMKNFPSNGLMPMGQGGFAPALDMYETKDALIVEAPLPGINPANVEVSVENGIVTVKGASTKEHEMDDKNYYRKEVRSGSFFRQIALPMAVKEDEVSAEFEDGVLKVTCPKMELAKPNKVTVKIIKKDKK